MATDGGSTSSVQNCPSSSRRQILRRNQGLSDSPVGPAAARLHPCGRSGHIEGGARLRSTSDERPSSHFHQRAVAIQPISVSSPASWQKPRGAVVLNLP